MSEQTPEFFKHLGNAAKRMHSAAIRALSKGKPAIFLPISSDFAGGIIGLVSSFALLYFVSPLVLTIRPEDMPLDFITLDVLHWFYWGLVMVGVCVAGAAVYMIYANAPTWAVVDAEAGQLRLRRLWGRSETVPLTDIDSVKLLSDSGNGVHRDQGCYFALVFAKRLFRPSIPLSNTLKFGKEVDDQASERLRPLLRALSAVARDETQPRNGESENHCWYRCGHLHYKAYHNGIFSLFRRFIIGNTVTVLLLYWLYSSWREELLLLLQKHNPLHAYGISDLQIIEGVWWLIAIRIFLDIASVRVALRIDQDAKTVSVFRCFGLWRSDYSFERFDGFMLAPASGTGFRAGLLLNIRDLAPPLSLSSAKHPDRLQRMLCETAGLLGVDAWDSFTPHPEEYIPPDTREKPQPEWLAKTAERISSHLEQAARRFGIAAERFDEWTKRRWPDKDVTE